MNFTYYLISYGNSDTTGLSLNTVSILEEMGGIVLNSNSELDLNRLKENYDNALKELTEFLDSNQTYKDLTIEKFKQEVKLFWERSDLWKQALENGIYSKEKLDEDFKLFKIHAKRLLL